VSATIKPVLVLVGPPGSGKSTVGELVASRLGVGFRDTDRDIEAAAGQPIADIFVDHGEPHFRGLERAAVAAALAEHDGVLALGGGSVMAAETRALLDGHRVVFLDVSVPEAAARVGFNRDRPLLLGNVRAQLRALLAERRPAYEAVAKHTVDTDGRTPDEIAEEIFALISAADSTSEGRRA
jgi:shikimate kinase